MVVWHGELKRPLSAGFAVAVIVALFTLALPNFYRSEARILPVDSKSSSGLGGLAATAAAFGVTVPSGDGGDANFVDILNSRWMAENLLNKKFTFKDRSSMLGRDEIHSETLCEYLGEKNIDRSIVKLATILGASRDLKTKVITIWAETKSPTLSQEIIQATTKFLEEYVQRKGQTRGGAKAAFAEARLKEAQEESIKAELEFKRFLETNRNFTTSGDPTVRLMGMRLEGEFKLRQQLINTLAVNREQALLEEKNDVPILNVLDEGNLPIERSRPIRSKFIFVAFLLTVIATWAWPNRKWIQSIILGRPTNETAPLGS